MAIEPPLVEDVFNSTGSLASSLESNNGGLTPVIKQVFPPSFKDPEVIKTAAQFVLPCVTHRYNIIQCISTIYVRTILLWKPQLTVQMMQLFL
jgi:hypothetical protein